MPRKRKSRLIPRTRGGATRYYGDFRDLGGKREPLIPSGETLATTDLDVANGLIDKRVKQLEHARRTGHLLGMGEQRSLAEFAGYHLTEKAKAGNVTEEWLQMSQKQLENAIAFFGAERDLGSIGTRDVQRWIAQLRKLSGRKGRPVSAGTVRHYLNALSNLYTRAQSESVVTPGYNPVAALMEKPTARRSEAKWLEVHEAALLLEAARALRRKGSNKFESELVYAMLATFLLTGGRRSEVLGLELEDVSFDRKTITFRPNEWRRLKTQTSWRSVPLWPQLEEILRAYVFGSSRAPGRLLFPSDRRAPDQGRRRREAAAKGEQMINDPRKAIDAVAEQAGWKAGEIRTKMFRHTYCAARLQTLDRGAPVSIFTVGRELGHGGDALVKRVYGHLGAVRQRLEVMEYDAQRAAAAITEQKVRESYEERLQLLRKPSDS